MKKKEEKNPVGRPKLADSKTKKESLLVGLFVLAIITIVGIIGYNIIMMDFNPKYNVGTVYNDHIKSCVVKNKKIDCGPLVTNMKYKLDDNSYVELTKEDKSIKVDITGSGKNNVDNIMLQDNIDKVSVSGPRSLVNKVKRVVGTVKVNGELNDFSQSIKLEPVDANGKVVEGIELEKDSVNVNITLLTQKTVPITLKLSDNSESGVNYTMSQNTVTIKGKKDIVDSINDIETQPVKLSEILPGTSKDIYLQVPSGITIETKYITIKKNSEENAVEEYTYTAKDIEIRNNTKK